MKHVTGLTSVTFRGLSCSEIVELAVKTKLTAIEWGGDVHVPVGDFEKAEKTKELCKKNNIKISSYGSYFRGLSDDFSSILRTAVVLNAPVIRVWAGNKSPENCSEEEFENLVKAFQNCADMAQKENVTIAFEYHRGTLTQNKESAYRLLNAINKSNVMCYWQPNPDISLDEQKVEIELLSPWIICFHVFAWTKGNEKHLLETAKKTWEEYAQIIAEKGRNINYILEFVKDDSVEVFEQDCKTLHEILANIKVNECKKQALFFSNMDKIFNSYDEKTIAKINEKFNLGNLVITSKNILQHLSLLEKTEVVFSTWGMLQLSEEEIKEYLPNLKAVFYGAGSVQSFAKPFLNLGIKVFSAWAANAIPVAEYTVAQIVLAGKGFFQTSYIYKNHGREKAREFATEQYGNYNIKVGILGAGMIGKLVMEKLKVFEYEVLVYDPFVSDETVEKLGAKKASLEEIFTSCQIISNHIANLPSTVGILNYSHFNLMKNNATFINTGRGAQLVEQDLIKMLKEKPCVTAVLDVFLNENAPERSEFEFIDNVFLTPHIAGSQANEVARMGKYMSIESEKWFNNETCEYEVSLKMLETMA